MKTLDEVIEKIESAWICPSCDEANEYCQLYEVRDDALYYLRNYKAHQADWSYAVANSEQFAEARDKHIKALAEMKRNDPLTWDELRQMEGKPVWVMDSNGQGEWVLLSGMEGDELFFVYRTCNEYKLYREEQGERWQAYRKERS